VLVHHWRLISGILLVILLGQALVWSVLKLIFSDRLTSEEYYSLSASGWIVPVSLISFLWLALGGFLGPESSGFVLLIFLAVLAIILFPRTRKESLPGSKAVLFVLLSLFGLFIFLRLAFLARAAIPLYFDSAQHYLIIRNLIDGLASNEVTSPRWPASTYYHIGFHFLAAFVASTLRAEIIDVMLVVGQLIVAAIPFGIFPIIKQETQSSRAGIFAVLLAAFGWYMPAYTVNWGKYPALASLPLIPFVLSLAYLSLRYKENLSRGRYLGLNTILLSGIVITALMHTRSLVIFAIFALAWITAAGWQRLPNLARLVSLAAVLLGILLEIRYIRTQDVFSPLFDPYWNQGLFITCIVLFLSLFALRVFPRLAFASFLVILSLLGSIFIPIRIPSYGNLTLLDRPFAEMILYLPLAYLGGAGLRGLEQSLQTLATKFERLHTLSGRPIGFLFIGLLLINALATYTLYPSDCCSIAGKDDMVAIDWMDKNLPAEARILISSTELWVLPSDSFQGAVGADGGVWITPLTGRATVLLPYYSDFSQPTTVNILCEMDVDYIYVGEKGATFNSGQIRPYPDTYKILLSMPKAKVYQVMGCQ
jgi:hypothetical protein